MKIVIAGSRGLSDPGLAEEAMQASGLADKATVIISGCCDGGDGLGEIWALRHGVPVDPKPADWKAHGKAGGKIRNAEMAVSGDAAVVLWNGSSPGSRDMIQRMLAAGKPVFVFDVFRHAGRFYGDGRLPIGMTHMDQPAYIKREQERAERLLEFVKGEVRSMYVGARLQFAADLFAYLEPEIKSLLKQGKITIPTERNA